MNDRAIRLDLMRRTKAKAQLANAPAPAYQSADRQRLALTVPVGTAIAINKLAKSSGRGRSQVLEAMRVLRKLEWSR